MNPREPAARLIQAWGPVSTEWSLHPDRIEIETRSPLGRAFSPVELARIDGFSVEEGPWPGLLLATAVALLLALGSGLAAVAGKAGLLPVFVAWLLAACLVTLAAGLRRDRIVLHTVGGRRFLIWLGLTRREELLDPFLQQLRHLRSRALSAPTVLPLPEPGPESGDEAREAEGHGGDEGPIDPRWIN